MPALSFLHLDRLEGLLQQQPGKAVTQRLLRPVEVFVCRFGHGKFLLLLSWGQFLFSLYCVSGRKSSAGKAATVFRKVLYSATIFLKV